MVVATVGLRAPLLLLLASQLTLINTIISEAQNDSADYDLCKPFTCGNISFTFPFSSSTSDAFSGPRRCGLPGYQIACHSPTSPAFLQLPGHLYQVKSLYASVETSSESDDQSLITVADDGMIRDLRSGSCGSLQNFSIPTPISDIEPPLQLPSFGFNLSFFKCRPGGVGFSRGFLDGTLAAYNCSEGYGLYLSRNVSRLGPMPRLGSETPSGCELVAVPVSSASMSRYGLLNGSGGSGQRTVLSDWFWRQNKSMEVILDALSEGFPLQWGTPLACNSCRTAGGRCGYDSRDRGIACFCQSGSCDPDKRRINWKLIAGVAAGISVLLLAMVVFIFKYNKSHPIFNTSCFRKNQTIREERKAKEFMENYRSTVLTSYSYGDIKKMANGFEEKLGEGGYGRVYKGKLPDGRAVAVKMLDKSPDIGHDFINEVTTIGTIHHVNVIRLWGFCWDGSKQALVYEHMPNGSLGNLLLKKNPGVGLGRMLEIAIGVAKGIEYLHNGCDSRILHLDIKPENVLLDHEFNPKISDFGLAKAFSRRRSVVTMTGARGTIGYIAPEIFLRRFGSPSDRSDVYSYGMLLLEMVGARNREDEPEARATSEPTFPDWIYDKLVEQEKMEVAAAEEEEGAAKKMVMVGLWCIQMNPRDRPSMAKVVDMLCGNAEAIAMPPKPFLFSPPRVQFESESKSTGSSSNFYSPTPSWGHLT